MERGHNRPTACTLLRVRRSVMADRRPLTPAVRPRKRKRIETPEQRIDLTQPEQHIYDSVRSTQDAQTLSDAMVEEKAGLNRMYVLKLIHGRLRYVRGQSSRPTHGQRSRLTHVNLSLSQDGIRGQCRGLEDTQELRRALQDELDNRNRKSVVQLLRARIQQLQARHR